MNLIRSARWQVVLATVLLLCAADPARAQTTAPKPASPQPALAQPPITSPSTPAAPVEPEDGTLPLWQRTLYKTLTYQAAANAADLLVFDMLVGASAATTTGFFITNAATAAAAYYGFEYAWQTLGPTLDETTEQTVVEKTVLYRFIGVGRNATLGYLFAGSAVAAGAFAGLNIVYDTSIFLANEYVWDVLRPQQPKPRYNGSAVPSLNAEIRSPWNGIYPAASTLREPFIAAP